MEVVWNGFCFPMRIFVLVTVFEMLCRSMTAALSFKSVIVGLLK